MTRNIKPRDFTGLPEYCWPKLRRVSAKIASEHRIHPEAVAHWHSLSSVWHDAYYSAAQKEVGAGYANGTGGMLSYAVMLAWIEKSEVA